MLHKIAYAGILGLIALCVGCTMCCHPYDYNGPVYDNSGQCLSNVRAGSILEGGDMETISDSGNQKSIEKSSPNARQGSPRGEEVEGATQILSVTDRKLDTSETVAKSQSGDSQPIPSLAQPAPARRR
jgi:hypothetical protein